ncbi:MAG: GGDEF domain-containing protein [Sphingomonadaceae bacterium]
MTPLFLLLALASPLLALLAGLLGWLLIRTRRRLERLMHEARHDALTGLPNRRGLEALWPAQLDPLALLMVDLVGFKAVNDAHGHLVGDGLLRQVAARLESAIPPPGRLGRWGGDEFVAIVPAAEAETTAQRLAAASVIPFDLSGEGGPARVAIGVRTGLADPAGTLEEALASAASRLHAARRTA